MSFEIALICRHFLMKFSMNDIDFQPKEYGTFSSAGRGVLPGLQPPLVVAAGCNITVNLNV